MINDRDTLFRASANENLRYDRNEITDGVKCKPNDLNWDVSPYSEKDFGKLTSQGETSSISDSGVDDLVVSDIRDAVELLELAMSRSAFLPSEFKRVGTVYDKLLNFLIQANHT